MNQKKTSWNRYHPQLLLAADALLIALGYTVTWLMLTGRVSLSHYLPVCIASGVLFLGCYLFCFLITGMYKSIWRYAEIYEFYKCSMASLLAILLFVVTSRLIFVTVPVPISVYVMSGILATGLTLYMRLFYRVYQNRRAAARREGAHRALIVGAGECASLVLRELAGNPQSPYNVLAAVDDDPAKIGRRMQGVRISGSTRMIPELVRRHDIDTILFAIQAIDPVSRREIFEICETTKCAMKIVPDIKELILHGEDVLSRIREVKVEDLLGREEILIYRHNNDMLSGKVVMVTGGGGSIGSELCRQIAAVSPRQLVIVDIYENNAYEIQQELLRTYGGELALAVEIASVRDEAKMDAIFARYRPDYVFHAAAHKHVPLMEHNPEEAVKNNIFGTLNTARCAVRWGCERFILISTDKAVNPTNWMGASKRVCEMVIQWMAAGSRTVFAAVRFGNVLGSNGSVIPLFKEQIQQGGPVTVTHPEIIRYFMTIPEAVSLVLTAGKMAAGGEIFILDMGAPVKILDLAEKLIRLSGFVPYEEIPIVFTGLRPGEKLYEELLTDEEGITHTTHEKIFIARPGQVDGALLQAQLETLRQAAEANDTARVEALLAEAVPTYHKEEPQKA